MFSDTPGILLTKLLCYLYQWIMISQMRRKWKSVENFGDVGTPNPYDLHPHKPEQFPTDIIKSSTELDDFVTPSS